jgi:YVTN family beta-propeller protein
MLGCGFLLGLLAWQAPQAAAQFVTRVYVTTNSGAPGSVSVFDHDTATNQIQVVGDPIPVGVAPGGIAITPDHSRVYVTNSASDNVSLLFGPTISVEHTPLGIAITPDGAYAYVANADSDSVWKIATATNQMAASALLPRGSRPRWIAITPDGTRVYVANQTDPGSVSVIDTGSNQVVGNPIHVGRAPAGIAIAPDGTYAYVTTTIGVDLINTGINQVVGQPIPVSPPPSVIATISHLKHITYVAATHWAPGSIYLLIRLPLTLTTAVDDATLVAAVTWDFYGDGSVVTTTTTLSTPFTYTRAGTFTPQVTVALTDGSYAPVATTLRVQSPTEGIDTLHALVDWLALDAGRTTSLVSKLTAAQDAITRGNAYAACTQLQAFEHDVEALVYSGHLAQESAALRLSQARAIQVSLGCS